MQENPNINISIQAIIDEIKKIKLLLLLAFIIFFVATYYYTISIKNIYKGTIEIKNINTIEFSEYQEIQNFSNLYLSIDQFYLRQLFIEELEDRKEIIEFFKNAGLINEDTYSNQAEYQKALEKKSFEIKIEYPNITNFQIDRELIKGHKVTFITDSRDKLSNLFTTIFDNVNKNVQKNLKDLALKKIKKYNEEKDVRIEDIENEIAMKQIQYQTQLDRDIIYLKQQQKIARALNISEPKESDIAVKNEVYMNDGRSDNLSFSQYYLKGYKAISEEIITLEERKNEVAFIENFSELVYEKQSLMSSREIERFEKVFLESIINSKNFKAASYNVNDILFKKLNLSQTTVVLASILVFFIVILSLVISRIIISQLLRQ